MEYSLKLDSSLYMREGMKSSYFWYKLLLYFIPHHKVRVETKFTIMRNIFINNYRKIVRDQTFVDHTDNLYHLSMPQDSGFDSTEGAYDMKEIHRIVGLLPKEYRIPFAMHVSGFKYREIAEKLGLPLGTVKSRIFFTRQRLQGQLRDFV